MSATPVPAAVASGSGKVSFTLPQRSTVATAPKMPGYPFIATNATTAVAPVLSSNSTASSSSTASTTASMAAYVEQDPLVAVIKPRLALAGIQLPGRRHALLTLPGHMRCVLCVCVCVAITNEISRAGVHESAAAGSHGGRCESGGSTRTLCDVACRVLMRAT
jgi:hypothetical protein